MKKVITFVLTLLLCIVFTGCSYFTDMLYPQIDSMPEITQPTTTLSGYVLTSVKTANSQLFRQNSSTIQFIPSYCAYDCDYVQIDISSFSHQLLNNETPSFSASIYWKNYPIRNCGPMMSATMTSKTSQMATITIKCGGAYFSKYAETYDVLYLTYEAKYSQKEDVNSKSTYIPVKIPSIGVSYSSKDERNVGLINMMQSGLREAGYELADSDSYSDPAEQVSDIEALITKAPDAIVIETQYHDVLINVINKCQEAGILVIAVNTNVPDEYKNAGIVSLYSDGSDEAGKNIANDIISILEGKDVS